MLVEEWKRKNPPIKRKPITNADCIRDMTDEELAMWCYRITTDAMSILQIGNNRQIKSCLGWLNWLKQEVKNNE